VTAQVSDHGRTSGARKSTSTGEKWDKVIEARALALLLPSLGIVAVVLLFIFASLVNNGKDLLGPAVAAVSTLAAASGGHAAGRADGTPRG
jgi:hypothetical protein